MNTIIHFIEELRWKPVDIKNNTYIHFDKEVNDKDPKFKVADHARISKYKKYFS